VKLEAWVVGITAGSREVPGRKDCDKRHPYRVIIIKSSLARATTKTKKSHNFMYY